MLSSVPRRPLLLALASLVLITSCKGSDSSSGVTPPNQTPTVAVAANSSTGTAARGSAATFPLTITRGGGYTGDVQLSAEGVPAGVIASFSPNPITSAGASSTLTLTVGANAAPGTNTITLRASGANVTSMTTTVSLTVPAPTITLVAGTAQAAVTQGATTTIPLTLTRSNGFTGPITIDVTGLPAGVSAATNPASPLADGVTATTLTLTASASAATGPATVVVRASGAGVTEQTATIALTVNAAVAPGFSLAANPAALTLTAGATGTSAIALTRQGGLASDVVLTVSGAPTGVTATAAPATLSGVTATSTLTIATTAAVVPGTYNLVVRGNAAGQTERTATVALTVNAPPGVAITPSPAALTIAQSQSATTNLVLARTGGLTGDLTLALENAPAGVTGTFAPNPATATTSALTINVGAAATPGTYTLTIRATGTGGASGTIPLTLTVQATATGSFTLSAAPSAVTIAQGANTLATTINIARTNFTGAINFAVTGLPSGITPTFTPASATGAQTALGLQVASTVSTGNYDVVIRGTATGLAEVQLPLRITVTAPTAGTTVGYRFCAQNALPAFFAYRNGTTGAWTSVSRGTNNSYNFTITSDVGGIAYGIDQGNGRYTIYVNYYGANEFPTLATNECLNSPATKSVTGTVAGLAASGGSSPVGTVSLGVGSATLATGATSFTIGTASDAASDLLAVRTSPDGSTADRLILRRTVTGTAGGSIGPVLDFNSAEAVAPATATYTVANPNGGLVFAQSTFQTGNGLGASIAASQYSVTPAVTVFGVPSNKLIAGDKHLVYVGAFTDLGGGRSVTRSAYRIDGDLVNRTVTLGPTIAAPTITSLGTSPYLRLRATGVLPAEYQEGVSVQYSQGSKLWVITASRAYITATAPASVRTGSARIDLPYTLDMPDLSGIVGFLLLMALVSGSPIATTLVAYAFLSGFTSEAIGSTLLLALFVLSVLF